MSDRGVRRGGDEGRVVDYEEYVDTSYQQCQHYAPCIDPDPLHRHWSAGRGRGAEGAESEREEQHEVSLPG